MIAPIITTVTVPHQGPSNLEIIHERALEYSSDSNLQRAFEDGAKYWLNYNSINYSPWGVLLCIYISFNIFAFFIGMFLNDDYFDNGYFNSPMKILFPFYGFGKVFGKIMFTPFK